LHDQCGESNVLGTQSAWTLFLWIFLHCIMIILIVDPIFGEIFNDKIIVINMVGVTYWAPKVLRHYSHGNFGIT
jgi:hypothetical protein